MIFIFLHHLHFADNNRKMPGFGHIDFDAIVSSLKKISYSNTISYEIHDSLYDKMSNNANLL